MTSKKVTTRRLKKVLQDAGLQQEYSISIRKFYWRITPNKTERQIVEKLVKALNNEEIKTEFIEDALIVQKFQQ